MAGLIYKVYAKCSRKNSGLANHLCFTWRCGIYTYISKTDKIKNGAQKMGKGDTPPQGNGSLPGEQQSGNEPNGAEPSPPTSREEVIQEGVFPGDVFRLGVGKGGRIDYRVVSSSEVEGDHVYTVETTRMGSDGKKEVKTQVVPYDGFIDFLADEKAMIVDASDKRYEVRYGVESSDDALEAALQYRASLEDGSESARLVDEDIDKMYGRKLEADIAAVESHLGEKSADDQGRGEKAGDTGPIPSESGESPRDELARLSVEYGEMGGDRNSPAAWRNKNRRKALKEWIDQDNAKSSNENTTGNTSTPATGETGPIPSESGESPRDEIARLRSEYGGMQYKDTDKAKAVLKRIDELHAWIENDNKQSRGEKSTDNKAEKSLDKLLEDFKASENLSDEEMQKFRKLIEVMVQAGMVNAPEKKEGEQKVETAEEKADRERKEKLETIKKEIEEEYGERRKADLLRYGERKADYDLSGRWGLGKRREALREAEKELENNRVAQIRALIDKKEEAGFYTGTPEEIEARKNLEFMMELSTIDSELQKANIDAVNHRFTDKEAYKKNFNWYQRRSMGFANKFFNKGGKLARGIKNAGMGALYGGAAAFTVAGMTFPIGSALAVGAGIGVRNFMTTGARLDTLRSAYAGVEVKEQPKMSEAEAEALLKRLKEGNSASDKSAIADYVQSKFGEQRSRGDEKRSDAQKRARYNALAFSAGALLGGIGGGLIGNALHSSPDVPSGASPDVPSATPEYTYADYNTNGAPEHLFQKLTGTSGARSEQLFHALAKEVGGYDNLFVDSNGVPVDLKDYGGSIDIGFTGWDQDGSARFSDSVREALERRGISVGDDLPMPQNGGRR